MDPLPLATGILDLVALAAQIVSAGYKLSHPMSRNTGELEALVNETAAFLGVLLSVKNYLESQTTFQADPEIMKKMLQDSKGTLQEISTIVDKLARANPVTVIVAGEAKKERLETLIQRVEQYKSFFMNSLVHLIFGVIYFQQSDGDVTSKAVR